MRPGLLLTLFFALFLTVAAGIALYAAGARDFRLPPGHPPSAAALADRCYALSFSARVHRMVDPAQRLPTVARLTARVSTESAFRGWYQAQRARADTVGRFPAYNWGQPIWRPAGPDSLDIAYVGWPFGLRMRLPVAGDVSTGRVVVNDDVGGHWDPLDVVHARRVPCAEFAFDDGTRTLR